MTVTANRSLPYPNGPKTPTSLPSTLTHMCASSISRGGSGVGVGRGVDVGRGLGEGVLVGTGDGVGVAVGEEQAANAMTAASATMRRMVITAASLQQGP